MTFLSLIAVLAIVYWTSAAQVIQRDAWFVWLLNRFRALPATTSIPILPMILALCVPLAVVIVGIGATVYFLSKNYLFFIYVPVFLYSLGRGDYIGDVNNYIATVNRGDNVSASKLVDSLCGRASDDIRTADVSDWKGLHEQALRVISYRGFERFFAVLFWFVLTGAVGALLYRLSSLYREQTVPGSAEAHLADKWLWIIEFPVVRLMGLTWAFVGNFDTCPWRESFFDTDNSSMTILNNSLRGALSAPTDIYMKSAETNAEANTEDAAPDPSETEEVTDVTESQDEEAEHAAASQDMIEDLAGIRLNNQSEPAYSFALVKSSVPLYLRSLLFWVGAIAFATLWIN